MSDAGSRLDNSQIEDIVERVDPSARLTPRRVLRRVIRRHFDLPAGKRPHELCFEISRDELLLYAPGEFAADTRLPQRVLLLPQPDDEQSTDEYLVDLWRRLFHARVDRVLDEQGADAGAERPLFNPTLLHEIQSVLESENRLPPPADEHVIFREFTALLLELKFFFPNRIADFFPGLREPHALADRVAKRLGAAAIFAAARPGNATLAGSAPPLETVAAAPPEPPLDDGRLRARAQAAAQRGNDVRAAILHRRLNDIARAQASLRTLADRLRGPLHLDENSASKWYDALRPLLEPAAHGFWTFAGRLLYELQKACLDVERKVYAVDLFEPIVTLGRHPVKRLLDKPREVNVLRRLRAALRLSRRARVTDEQRRGLEHLIHHAIEDTGHRVRAVNRPILCEVFDRVGIIPVNQAERIAREKIVEELLDNITGRGFFNLSDVRDSLARNRLKLDDLDLGRELIKGDAVIRANRRLAMRLDGIYRPGEIYLRGLQRVSSLAFGTALGRALMLFVILPFGGSYVALEGTRHFIKGTIDMSRFAARKVVGDLPQFAPIPEHRHYGSWMTEPLTIILLGLFLFGLIHVPPLRRRIGKFLSLVLTWLTAVFRSPLVMLLFDNLLMRLAGRYLLLPALIGAAALLTMRLCGYNWESSGLVAAGAALLIGTFFRTTWGEGLGEQFDEVVSHVWRIFSVTFVWGVITWFLHVFSVIFEAVEKGIYAVDEWLRFHEGEGRARFTLKLITGAIWSIVAYVFKFTWNLLAEPQINPIKHFPVVTVSHKLLWPMTPSAAAALNLSPGVVGVIFFCIPGIFGFLVWEFKENWKLYKANASRRLGPVAVGGHGERVRRLLRPGFHSGIIPKTFAKLRRAESTGNSGRASRLRHKLDHVAEAIQHLARREPVAYLQKSRRWDGLPICVEPIRLATNRIRIPLTIHHQKETLIISIEERGGWLIGSIEQTGWLNNLNDKQRSAFADVLTELYMLCGVNVVREQAANFLGIDPDRLDCRPEGLVILPRRGESAVTIDYTDEPLLHASGPINGQDPAAIPVVDLILSDRPIEWNLWIERWEEDHAGKLPAGALAGDYRVL